jgi:hypothetical protein
MANPVVDFSLQRPCRDEHALLLILMIEAEHLWEGMERIEEFNRLKILRMAPRARFELATLRLTAECSTVELPGSRKPGVKIVSASLRLEPQFSGLGQFIGAT